jgi:hypothetical protein
LVYTCSGVSDGDDDAAPGHSSLCVQKVLIEFNINRNVALLRELDGIAQNIDKDLFEPLWVSFNGLWQLFINLKL